MRGKGGKTDSRNSGVTIIRREEVTEAESHGGAWKVAYADFVTAMMAFFLLMWLLNATTEDQRKGLADYFSPNNLLSHASSGTGQPFSGHTVFDQGAMVSDRGAVQVIVGRRPAVQAPDDSDADTPLLADRHNAAEEAGPAGRTDAVPPGSAKVQPANPPAASAGTASATAASATAASATAANSAAADPVAVSSVGGNGMGASAVAASPVAAGSLSAKMADAAQPAPVVARAVTQAGDHAPTEAELLAAQALREKQAFEQAAEELRQAVRGDPALAALSRQLAIDITPEGLRIQLLDEERLPMFATGSANPNERAQLLLAKVAPVLMRLPEEIAVVGHTDSAPYAGNGKTNWELSTERANATRRLLTDAGLADTRISRVTGLADRDPLLPADPLAAANRRIAIIVLRGTAKPAEPAAAPPTRPSAPAAIAPPASPGVPSSAAPSAAPFIAKPAAPPAASPQVATPGPPPAPSSATSPPLAPPVPSSTSPSGRSFAPASTPPSIAPPAPSSAATSAPTSASTPGAAPAPSSDQPSDAPSAPPAAPPPVPSFAPSFVPSFVPSFAPPSAAPAPPPP